MSTRRRTVAKGDATRAALIAAARKLFVTNGYFATGTEDIVAEASVGTRGSAVPPLRRQARPLPRRLRSGPDRPRRRDRHQRTRRPARHAHRRAPTVPRRLRRESRRATGSLDRRTCRPRMGTVRDLEAQYGLGAITAMLDTQSRKASSRNSPPRRWRTCSSPRSTKPAVHRNADDRRQARNRQPQSTESATQRPPHRPVAPRRIARYGVLHERRSAVLARPSMLRVTLQPLASESEEGG